MLVSRQLLLYSLILCISFSFVKTAVLSSKFNITLKTPGNISSPTVIPHKSVHVQYTLSNDNDRWTIVGFEPLIQFHKKAIEQLTVHLCDSITYNSIWYDDKTICNDAESMLIYEWTSYSSLSSFRISDNYGFQLNRSKSIVFTVIYKKEKRVHREQSGIILYISIEPPKFQMGTMFVGNKQKGIRFSCRSSNIPRLLYGIKKLYSNKNNIWWRIYIIRMRQFGRKLIQLVFDSKIISNVNKSNIEIVSTDIFLMENDYLLIECENISQTKCYFLIYYIYKSKLNKNNNICQNNDFSNLFKLIPSREILNKNQTKKNSSNIDGSTIFILVCVLSFIIWISIIIICIIIRRIRGLVNFRTVSTFPLSSQKNNLTSRAGRNTNDQHFHRTGDADHIMQIDGEHGGFIS